jgi:hypothetical protein
MNNFFTAADILNIPRIRKSMSHDYAVAVRTYGKFLKQLEPKIKLNRQLLHEACASAYCDIFRLTVFRGIKNADAHKRVAFLTKWIVKSRPVYILKYEGDTDVPYANEVFALIFALITLNIPPYKIRGNAEIRNYIDNLKYLLHYHSCAPEQLASEFFLLERYVETL